MKHEHRWGGRAVALSALLGVLLLAACHRPAAETEATTNAEFKVEKLFEHDGCTMYRFNDGRWIYYAKCSDGARTEWQEGCGKNCSRKVSVLSPNASLPPTAKRSVAGRLEGIVGRDGGDEK